MARDPAIWYVVVGGEKTGPMSRAEVGLEFATGAISGETDVWREGMADWAAGAEVPELAAIFVGVQVPPPPGPPPLRAPPLRSAAPAPTPASAPRQLRGSPVATPAAAAGDKNGDKAKGLREFDMTHFRKNQAAEEDESNLTIEHDIRLFKLGVEGYGDMLTAKPTIVPGPPRKQSVELAPAPHRGRAEITPPAQTPLKAERVAAPAAAAPARSTPAPSPRVSERVEAARAAAAAKSGSRDVMVMVAIAGGFAALLVGLVLFMLG